MFSFLLTSCLLLIYDAAANVDQQAFFKQSSSTLTNCTSIQGNFSGCFECFDCRGADYQEQIRRHKTPFIVKLPNQNKNCEPTDFCCFSQYETSARETENCGKSNPSGYPRSLRKSLKSVLPGQYPWRVWIFREIKSDEPLCAGVYIDANAGAVITSAFCVYKYSKEELLVGFERNIGSIHIRNLTLHEEYSQESLMYDIALLSLSPQDILPPFAAVACLPTLQLKLPTACLVISEEDNYINTITKPHESCKSTLATLHDTQLCAVTSKYDYTPEFGGGIFCEEETSPNSVSFVVRGLKLNTNREDGLSLYVDMANLNTWLLLIMDDWRKDYAK